MARENAETKGRRYLTEGRIEIIWAQVLGTVVAKAHGETGTYDCGFDAAMGEWRCTCEARGRCAHLVALQLVTRRMR